MLSDKKIPTSFHNFEHRTAVIHSTEAETPRLLNPGTSEKSVGSFVKQSGNDVEGCQGLVSTQYARISAIQCKVLSLEIRLGWYQVLDNWGLNK